MEVEDEAFVVVVCLVCQGMSGEWEQKTQNERLSISE
jgi:hypothetical protein